MIPQQKDRKSKFIFIYTLFFILITSINNKNFHNKELFSIIKFVIGKNLLFIILFPDGLYVF